MSQHHLPLAILREAYRPFAPLLQELWLAAAPLLPDTLRDELVRLGRDLHRRATTASPK